VRRFTPALLAWALVSGLCTAPYVRAALDPPRGHAFLGSFYFITDVYNYFGYVQQAADGAFLFRNKLTLEPHTPALVNLEWWAVGRLSALLGGSFVLAWRLLALAASLPFVLLVDAWLRRAGLPPTHRLPGLMLVLLGGGFGGLLYTLRWPPGLDVLDLSTGLFPFIELLANPHFVCGTTLVMGALLLLTRGGGRATAAGVVLIGLAGLVRPYDMVMAVAVFGLATVLTETPARAARRLLPLLGLLPVVAYVGWVFYVETAYRVFAAEAYTPPPLRQLAFATGPALALAGLVLFGPPPGPEARRARVLLLCWAVAALLVGVLRPVSFSLQFLVGIGVPLLGLAAVGLARYPPWLTLAATLCLCSSAVVALRVVSGDQPRWFVPAERVEAARALRTACRPGEVAMAPTDVGVYALAHTPCSPYSSHPVMRDAALHREEVEAFYAEWGPAERAAFLDAHRVAAVLVPRGERPEWFLGPGTPFRAVGGEPAGSPFAAYRRPLP
jgi:hypothetical protein